MFDNGQDSLEKTINKDIKTAFRVALESGNLDIIYLFVKALKDDKYKNIKPLPEVKTYHEACKNIKEFLISDSDVDLLTKIYFTKDNFSFSNYMLAYNIKGMQDFSWYRIGDILGGVEKILENSPQEFHCIMSRIIAYGLSKAFGFSVDGSKNRNLIGFLYDISKPNNEGLNLSFDIMEELSNLEQRYRMKIEKGLPCHSIGQELKMHILKLTAIMYIYEEAQHADFNFSKIEKKLITAFGENFLKGSWRNKNTFSRFLNSAIEREILECKEQGEPSVFEVTLETTDLASPQILPSVNPAVLKESSTKLIYPKLKAVIQPSAPAEVVDEPGQQINNQVCGVVHEVDPLRSKIRAKIAPQLTENTLQNTTFKPLKKDSYKEEPVKEQKKKIKNKTQKAAALVFA